MNREPGFTLVELLLSLVGLAVLAALGGAVFSSVHGKAQTVECVGRLRALGQGVVLYAAEQGGRFPRSDHSGASWAMALAPYLGEPKLETSLEYRNRRPFLCPSHREANTPEPAAWSYGLNVFFELSSTLRRLPNGMPMLGSADSYRGAPATWHRMGDVPLPARTILMAENPHARADHFMAHQWSNNLTAGNSVAGKRHGGKANFLFVDGHVRTLSVAETFDTASDLNLWNPSTAR